MPGRSDNDDDLDVYRPTPQEIKRQCAEFRAKRPVPEHGCRGPREPGIRIIDTRELGFAWAWEVA